MTAFDNSVFEKYKAEAREKWGDTEIKSGLGAADDFLAGAQCPYFVCINVI